MEELLSDNCCKALHSLLPTLSFTCCSWCRGLAKGLLHHCLPSERDLRTLQCLSLSFHIHGAVRTTGTGPSNFISQNVCTGRALQTRWIFKDLYNKQLYPYQLSWNNSDNRNLLSFGLYAQRFGKNISFQVITIKWQSRDHLPIWCWRKYLRFSPFPFPTSEHAFTVHDTSQN